MKLDTTTFAGAVAGAALALAAVPGIPKSLAAIAGIVGGAGVGALGWHAKTCPPNCPGTDGLGKPVRLVAPPDRRVISVACFLAFVAGIALLLLSGCTLNRVTTTRTGATEATNSVERTTLTSWAFLDSNQSFARASAHSGYATNGTWAPGISLSGLNQSASSTGLVVLIQNVLPAAAAAAAK